jgi:glucosyl-dolichyl phosphate glucuronosyltransferase
VVSAFAVVICAHDGRRWGDLQEAVVAVRRQTLSAQEIIVVVDRNQDLLRRAMAELEGVKVVPNDHHPGLGGARNSGIAASDAPLVAFIDDDAVARECWLELLAAPYEDPAVAGVGGSIEPRWEVSRPTWFPEEFDWVVGCTYRGMPNETREVRNLIGCNMTYRRDILEALGGFRLGYGCDETELCIRLRQRWPEKKLVHVPEAAVSHHVPASRATFARFLSRCYFEGGSKAVVASLVGRDRGLASERVYALRTLPPAIAAGVTSFVRDGDRSAIERSGAIVLGFLATAAGYAKGRLSLAEAAHRRGWAGSDGGAIRRGDRARASLRPHE